MTEAGDPIYVCLINDRHTDPQAKVFTTLDGAIEAARAWVSGQAHPERFQEEEVEGWLFCVSHEVEEDGAWVTEQRVEA